MPDFRPFSPVPHFSHSTPNPRSAKISIRLSQARRALGLYRESQKGGSGLPGRALAIHRATAHVEQRPALNIMSRKANDGNEPQGHIVLGKRKFYKAPTQSGREPTPNALKKRAYFGLNYHPIFRLKYFQKTLKSQFLLF